MGRSEKAKGTGAVNGGRCAQNGRPERGALADHDGSGRDVAALYPRRRLIMTGPGRSRARPARP